MPTIFHNCFDHSATNWHRIHFDNPTGADDIRCDKLHDVLVFQASSTMIFQYKYWYGRVGEEEGRRRGGGGEEEGRRRRGGRIAVEIKVITFLWTCCVLSEGRYHNI